MASLALTELAVSGMLRGIAEALALLVQRVVSLPAETSRGAVWDGREPFCRRRRRDRLLVRLRLAEWTVFALAV